MGTKTGIEWTDHTFNAWIGCTKVSAGCTNCYAAAQNKHWKWNGGAWGPGALRKVTGAENWREPLKWAKAARANGVREKVFCNSLSDTFDHQAPVEARKALWTLVGDTFDALDWQFVTKRPQRIPEVMSDDGLNDGFFEVCKCWLLTSTENQPTAEQRIPLILDVPAAVHGVSAEPLLGMLNLTALERQPSDYDRQMPGFDNCAAFYSDVLSGCNSVAMRDCDATCSEKPLTRAKLDWVICGGESGPGARPMHPGWARSLRDQCAAAGVPFFFKQWGEWGPTSDPAVAAARGIPLADCMSHLGKHAAGALLDGVGHKAFPEVR